MKKENTQQEWNKELPTKQTVEHYSRMLCMFYSCILLWLYVNFVGVYCKLICDSYAQASYSVLSEIGSFLKFIINGFFV